MKILVVDDSPTMRRIHIYSLKGLSGLEVLEAADGEEALSRLEATPGVDVILTDWNMPGMNGLDFIKRVTGHPRFGGIPIILVTTNTERATVIEAVKAGVRSYLVRPYAPETLRERIHQVLPQEASRRPSGGAGGNQGAP